MYYKIRRILTWTLTAAVVLSSNSVTVLAENEDFSEFQDVEEDVSVTEDEVDFESETEIFRQPDIQTDVQEEVFSAGDNDEYAIWFQDSGDEEKNGFLYAYSDIKSARFYLNTDNLRDKDATIFIASSVGSQTQLKSAIESGAKDFIQKPLDTQQVVNLIEKYIGGKQ